MPGLGSNNFNPGVVSAQQSGASIAAEVYPLNDAGIARSCEVIAEKIRLGMQDPRVLGWGDAVLKAAKIDGRDKPSNSAKARALLEAFRQATVYRSDPPNTEYIQSAAATLCLGPNLCVSGGDCDDMVVALGSVFLAQSIPTQVVKQFYGAQHQQHVLLVFEDGGTWYYADPSTRDPITTVSRATSEEWFSPLDYRGVTGADSASAEIVTLGRPLAWLGIGADTLVVTSAGPYAQASADLQNQVAAVINAGDTYLAANPPEYANAIQAYMAAGQAGVTSVGPEIDLAGSPNVTSPITAQAAAVNAQLQAQGAPFVAAPVGPVLAPDQIPTGPVLTATPTAADAQTSQAYAKQLLSLYDQAIALGAARPNTNAGPGAAPLTPAVSPVWIALGAAVVGGALWGAYRLHTKGARRRAKR